MTSMFFSLFTNNFSRKPASRKPDRSYTQVIFVRPDTETQKRVAKEVVKRNREALIKLRDR